MHSAFEFYVMNIRIEDRTIFEIFYMPTTTVNSIHPKIRQNEIPSVIWN